MAENIHRGIDENGDPTHDVTDDHKDAPKKSAPDVERLAPVPESTVTVRGEGMGGHCVMTASEHRAWVAKQRMGEEEAAEVKAAEEAEAAEAAELAELEAAEAAELAAAEEAEAAELAELEAAELAAAEAANIAERDADQVIAEANTSEKVEN